MNTENPPPATRSKTADSKTERPKRLPPERRNYKLNVRLSASESMTIKLRAEQMGMRPAQFIRQVALTCLLPSSPVLPSDEPAPRFERLLDPIRRLPPLRKQFTTPTLLGFLFVLVLFLVMAVLVSTEAEGTDPLPLPPEISEPIDEDFDEPPAPMPPPKLYAPETPRPYLPPSIYQLDTQLSDLESDIFLLKLIGGGAGGILFLVLLSRAFAPRPPPSPVYLREREIEAVLAALERQGDVLGQVGQVLADRLRPRPE